MYTHAHAHARTDRRTQTDNDTAHRESRPRLTPPAVLQAQFGLLKAEQPFDDVVAELKQELLTNGADTAAVSRSLVSNALVALFGDAEVGTTAMQVAVKRFCAAANTRTAKGRERLACGPQTLGGAWRGVRLSSRGRSRTAWPMRLAVTLLF